jgi:hypothetical protein
MGQKTFIGFSNFFIARACTRTENLRIASYFGSILLLGFCSSILLASRVSENSKNITKADLGMALSAIDALGRSRDEAAVDPLAQAFKIEKRMEVRRAIVDAMGLLRYASSIPTLKMALQDKEPQVRQSAVVALESVGGAESEMALLAQASSEKDFSVKTHLVQVMGRSRNAKSKPALESLAADKDPQLQKMAQTELDRKAKSKKP